MKSKLVLIICFAFSLPIITIAQEKSNIQWGKMETKDFNLPNSSIIDGNTNAVIIADMGQTRFEGNKKGWFSYVYKRKTRIKILDKKGFDAGEVRAYLFNGEKTESRMEDLVASTYNIENGKVVETKLNPKDVFVDFLTKYYTVKKFALPGLKEGSIIEYSYSIKSDNYFQIPSWSFQHAEYPCLWSEYEVRIPTTLSYVFVKQGLHDFQISEHTVGHETMRVSEDIEEVKGFGGATRDYMVSTNTNNLRWVMKDVPGLNISMANYVSSASNYVDMIEFQLSKVFNGAESEDVLNSWPVATTHLLSSSYFGTPIRYNREWLDNDLRKICGPSTVKLEQAKKIFYWLATNFTCNDRYDWTIHTTLNDVFEKKKGSVGDINLLLIAMLREQNIQADPVILSTREYGKNYIKYPVYSKLNYVVCRVSIDEKVYFLDASDQSLGFGQLPGYCYNGHARVISEKDSASIFFVADSLKEQGSTNVIIINDDKGNPSGGFQTSPGSQEAYDIRKKIKKSGINNFFKEIQTSYGSDFTLSNSGVDSLNEPEEPLSYHYDFDFGDIRSSNIFYFNPMLPSRIAENPFKSADRKFPVEMPYSIDELYTFSMEIPKGFIVDETPQSAKITLNGTDGAFEYLIQKTDADVQLRCHLVLRKATYDPAEYNTLRDFFAFVVEKENEKIVFKKK